MQSRRATTGRPSGTDGSDFSYRMLVDPRYTKVARGKSHLKALLIAQTLNQVMGSLWVFSSASQEKGLDNFSVISIFTGFISLIIGELGRRRSQATLLGVYTILSSIAIVVSVVCMVKSGLFLKVTQYPRISTFANFELIEAAPVLLGLVLQVIVIFTTLGLVHNMSPPKRSS